MLMAGGSLSAGVDNPQYGTSMPFGAVHPIFQKCEAMRPLTGWGGGLARIQSPIGKPCVMPLEVPDPSLEPWRQEALKRGYHMSASFPLISLGGIIGSLTVVAADPGEFDVIGLDLLGQVAGGLSYGLRALRDRRARAASVVQLAQSIEATVAALATMLDERDPYTADHQRRVADLAVAIARELAMTEADVHGIRLAALIHDVGKIAVPAEILNRPGKLTAAQFEIVKTHVQAGFDIVKGIAFPWPVAQTILQHHERLDGSGYPNGLKRDGILLDARIVAVADVVDAINSFRPYRPSRGAVAAIMEIEGGKGRHFDPDVVDACVRALRNGTFEFEMETN
jgi:putative nucleotidyltransferase with HDIG domain